MERDRLVEQFAESQTRLAATSAALQDKTAAVAARDLAIADRDAQLAGRNAALVEASKPELPVRITFRSAWAGQGQVAQIHNLSSQAISVVVNFSDPRVGQSKSFVLAINGNLAAEVGHQEGWAVTPGQTIQVVANGFKPVTVVSP